MAVYKRQTMKKMNEVTNNNTINFCMTHDSVCLYRNEKSNQLVYVDQLNNVLSKVLILGQITFNSQMIKFSYTTMTIMKITFNIVHNCNLHLAHYYYSLTCCYFSLPNYKH